VWSQWCPTLSFKICDPYFMFGPRLLHGSKMCSPLWFLDPLLRNPGDGSGCKQYIHVAGYVVVNGIKLRSKQLEKFHINQTKLKTRFVQNTGSGSSKYLRFNIQTIHETNISVAHVVITCYSSWNECVCPYYSQQFCGITTFIYHNMLLSW